MPLDVTETPPLDGYGNQLEPPLGEYSFFSESELKEAVRMKEAYKCGSEKLYDRTLWQRILNKKVEL